MKTLEARRGIMPQSTFQTRNSRRKKNDGNQIDEQKKIVEPQYGNKILVEE